MAKKEIKEKPKQEIRIQPINLKTVKIPIVGKSPLLSDKFPDKVKKQILEKQIGKTKSKKEIRNIKSEVELAIHKTSKGVIGFPAGGFKGGMIEHSVGSNTKFTPQFHDWGCDLIIEFDENNISAQDLVILLNYAGHYYGIGSWRPGCKCGGNYGMYEVKSK